MADFSKICQESLESVKQFLEEANANTPEVNQPLERLNEVALILSSSIQDEEVKVNQKWLESMRNLCKRLLFGGWTKLIMTMACHSSFLNGVETQQRADETIKLPSHMQKKVDEITKYSKRCQEILERTDEIMHSLIEKVCKAKNDNFEGIADKDIRTLQTALENLEGDLEASEIYLKSSREAFNELKSDIDAEKKWNDKVKVVTIAAGCLAIAITIGGVVLHVSLPIASQMGAVQKFNELLDEENMNPQSGPGHHSYIGNDDEISTLPSPSSSVVDLDSSAGTVETEVLLSSYKGSKTAAPGTLSGSYSSKVLPVTSPKTASWKTHSQSGKTEYPSWVSSLGKEYPSWVEDLDTTTRENKVKYSPDEKYSSSTSSPSGTFVRKKPFGRSSQSKSALKLSDLQCSRLKDPSRVKKAESNINGTDWNDGASTDTDMLLSQSVYGPNPVNMGGNFHSSLYQDKKVARLKKESTKKLRKSTGKIKSREHSTVSPRRSKSLTLSPTKSLRFSASNEYSEGKEGTPLRMAVPRDSSPGRSPFTSLPSRYSIPLQNERYAGSSAESALHSASPKMTRKYVSPPVVTRYSKLPVKKEEVTLPLTARREPSTSPSSATSPSRVRIPLKTHSPSRNEESDVESEDTDREMRKSPTGIKMEKMYRDPNTMYPWKTMIQSSKSRDSAAADPKPQYYSTPKISTGRNLQKPFGSSLKHPYSSRTSYGGLRGDQRVVFSEPSGQRDGREARAQEEYKSPNKPVFAGSSYRSRDEKLAKSAPDTRYRKPPIPTRSTGGKLSHRRSKTVPDLRRVAMRSASRPRSSRRSLDDDVVSVNTVDTETLITHPPMPLFDVSPSLTTVSDSDTLVESETETDTHISVVERSQMSLPHVADVSDKFSPTSVFASTNPHAAVREELPQRFHLWKLDEDIKTPDSFITRRFTNPKSGIISSFLDDCLSVDSEDKTMKEPNGTSTSAGGAMRLSGKEAAPGPVEALKQMLFTMQDMAHHETLDNEDSSYYKSPSSMDFKSKVMKDSLSSDDQSERDADIMRGEVSLQRAYHHLERLKRLVGKEDDRSSISSAN